jgi:ABC-type spermidine/putrescine transport system permease subunit II
VGAALTTAILSFHEIESTVIVWPPGRPNLAQEMLDALHFQRDERLGAAAVSLMGAGIVMAYVAAWLMLRAGRSGSTKARS